MRKAMVFTFGLILLTGFGCSLYGDRNGYGHARVFHPRGEYEYRNPTSHHSEKSVRHEIRQNERQIRELERRIEHLTYSSYRSGHGHYNHDREEIRELERRIHHLQLRNQSLYDLLDRRY